MSQHNTFWSLLICCFFCIYAQLSAQTINDSEDSVQLLIEKATYVQNPSEALSYLKQAIHFIDVINDSLKSQLNFALGLNYGRKYINDSANHYLQKALQFSAPYSGLKLLRADIYNSLGNVSRSQSLNEDAMSFFNMALLELDGNNTNERYYLEAKILGNIGGIYFDFQDFEKALYFAENSKEIALNKGFKDRYLISYLMVAYVARAWGKLDIALENNQLALAHVIEESDSSYIAHLYHNIASIYKLKNQWSEALKHYDKAEKIARIFEEEELLVSILLAKSEFYLESGQLSLAYNLAEEIKEKASDSGLLPKYIEALDIQYAALKAQGKYLDALNNREHYQMYKDSLFKADTKEKIADIEIKYETQKKEQTILQLEQEKEISQLQRAQERQLRYIMFLVAAILLLAVGLVFYRYRVKVRTSKILDLKNEELQKLNTTKDKLFAIISHDLKSPLSAFHTITSSLDSNWEQLEKEQIHEYIVSLRDSSAELYSMMDNLLRWALSQAEQIPFNPTHTDLQKMTASISKELYLALEAKSLKIKVEVEEGFSLLADQDMLKIMLRNLISNAIKFSKNGKTIVIKTAYKGHLPIVKIIDQGIGMTKEESDMLFVDSSKAQNIKNSHEKGTGLGLMLCKELIEKHQGRIEVQSEKGKGSTFQLIFPI